MPFPAHDPYWQDTAAFIQAQRGDNDAMLAPDEFADRFPVVYGYAASHAPGKLAVQWVVLHKGMLDRLRATYLSEVRAGFCPVFANAVFVVYLAHDRLPRLPDDLDHYRALLELLEAPRSNLPAPPPLDARPMPMRAFRSLDVEGVRAEMNRRYSQSDHDDYGGYEHPHLWDRVRYAEVDRLFAKLIGSVEGLDVLELACGIGRNVSLFGQCQSYVGIDLSDVAVEKARRYHAHRPHFTFRQMDAMRLDFPETRFDCVAGIEMIEHLQDAERMLREVYRVLRPGGRFVFDCTNRDSLHLRILRKLGLPEYVATYEHFREFGFTELKAIVNGIGFQIEASEGVFLLPYRELPAIDPRLTALSYDDPEVVEMMRELGQRAGPEFGFEFIIAARK